MLVIIKNTTHTHASFILINIKKKKYSTTNTKINKKKNKSVELLNKLNIITFIMLQMQV